MLIEKKIILKHYVKECCVTWQYIELITLQNNQVKAIYIFKRDNCFNL